jgi:ABC-type uncharacterized transport system substrate-binding protein
MKTILFLLIALLAAPLTRAQAPAAVPRVGVLQNGTVAINKPFTDAFARGLAELGYVDGKNIVLEVRYADGKFDRLPALAQELVHSKIQVLFTPSALATMALKKAGISVPIVFALAPDPVGEGFAASLARPGGNMTGLTSLSPEISAKRVELLREAFPGISRLAVLYSLGNPGVAPQLAEAERAAKVFNLDFIPVEAKQPDDFEPAFAQAVRQRASALLVIENPMYFHNRETIVALAEKHRLPAIYISKEYADSGGLMSYGSNYIDLIRRAAGHVDKILRGAKAGDLPIEQPIRYELVVNLKAARAIGLKVPQSILLRAERVIE